MDAEGYGPCQILFFGLDGYIVDENVDGWRICARYFTLDLYL